MLKVALTGGIATGKSYVLDRLRLLGVPCLDADDLAHGVMAAGTEATQAIGARFGVEVLDAGGAVDRRKLAPLVFADASARHELEAIVHPPVYRAIEAGFRAFAVIGGSPVAVVAVPLLYETGHAGDFSKVVITTCAPAVQLVRLRERGLSELEASQRVAAQMPASEKAARADFVIHTDGTFGDTDAQVEHLIRLLLQ